MHQLPTLETKRTLITVLHEGNAPALLVYQLENKDHLEPWEPAKGSDFYSVESGRLRGEKSYQAFLNGTAVSFIAFDKSSRKLVANCNFTNIVKNPLFGCNLGYSVCKTAEGVGLGQEVVAAGIHYMFEVAGLHRIMANHMPYNMRSEKLLKTLGFEREGYAKAYLKINGKWEDMVLNSLINHNV
jgi:ribosomal-protein-alanine N-acetyltransferase